MNQIPIDHVAPDPDQPRQTFSNESLEELAASIREHGVIQPIVVEPNGSGTYVIQAGERRWRAAQIAGLTEIPAFVGSSTPDTEDRFVRALVENLQREDLNPIDEGYAYARLQEAGLSNIKIVRLCGVSPPRVAARLILLKLDPKIQQLVAAGELSKSPDVAKALLSIPDQDARVEYAKRSAKRGLTIKGIVAGCRRIITLLEADALERGKTPSLNIATRRRASEWNLVKQIELDLEGRMPPWQTVELAAEKTCQGCSLLDMASIVVCGNCPGVELVAHMIELEANRVRKRHARAAD
ncbi:hypothetical protein LCGC14_0400810 [marine sediment metagenome]|uniref:ParB-like N-terminal domain-containing protein n=1 Tax=marine sediment metagenome TaxID=412755 RepID=A0A0F9W5T8_9ZZZZ